jgi:hypothetical protein
MDLDGDELAGVVDLFGGLTREELDRALAELAFRRGEDPPESADELVTAARFTYRLVAAERDDETYLVAGPAAFPRVPDDGEDLPHILDVRPRSFDRETLGDAVTERLAAEAADAGPERAETLVEVTYDAEAWAPVDLDDVRDELR